MIAKGTFEVKLQPLDAFAAGGEGAALGRLSIEKRFSGDLQGHSIGEMLSVRTAVEGSAGYVAVEKVTGTLGGRSGSFALMHYGTMAGGENHLILEVVPDSGTGDLEALMGKMALIIEEDQHYYELEYEFD